MRKYLIGSMLILPLVGSAEPKIEKVDTQILCSDTVALFNELRREYNEQPLLMGETSDQAKSTMSLWISKSGETWTIIASKNSISCVIGAGYNLKIIRKGKTV